MHIVSSDSYRAGEVLPHRKAALAWVRANEEDAAVRTAINAVASLYYAAGRRVEAFRLAGLPPEVRVLATWTALRDRGVDPREVVATWLAIEATIKADPQADTKDEFKHVQAAKLLHRMGGGAHKRWERPESQGSITVAPME